MRNLAVFGLLLFVLIACRTSKEPTTRVLTSADYPYIRTFHSAVRFKAKGQYKEAIQAFDSCFTARPTDDAAAFGLAQCYLLVNDKTKSAQYTEQASKLDPDNIWYTQELAYMYYNQGKFEEATKCFSKMIEKEPKNIDWLFGYADLLRRTNKPGEAIAALDKMEDQLGVLPDISIQKFELYIAAKQEDKALNELFEARMVHPDDLQLIGTLVDFYFQKRETAKAQEMLVELVKNDPNNGRANLALGELYLRQFKKPEAYKYFKAAFEGEGVDVDTKIKVLVMLMEQQVKIEPEVIELTEIMTIKHPTDAKSYSIKGDVLLQNGNKKKL
jgi:tetratricopeptide (TPR) repeat protein